MSTIGRIGRYVGSLRPPIRITISSQGDNDYQELKSDSVLSRSPASPRASLDDYPPFSPGPVTRVGSNDFADTSDIVWLKIKIRERTIFGLACPRILPRGSLNVGAWKRAYNQRKRWCTRRQCLITVAILILLAIAAPLVYVRQLNEQKEVDSRKGWGYGGTGISGLDVWGWPLWEKTFVHLQYNYEGLKTLVPKDENVPEFPPIGEDEPTPTTYTKPFLKPTLVDFKPYPDYSSEEYHNTYVGQHIPCDSYIAGQILKPSEPLSKPYRGIPWRRPDAVIGSSELLGIDDTVCWEKNALLQPYGFGDNTTVPLTEDWKNVTSLDFSNVNWSKLQNECVIRNRDRFDPSPTSASGNVPIWTPQPGAKHKRDNSTAVAKYQPRTAVVFRCWDGFKFLPEDFVNLRRIITELSLMSGGEYQVHMIIDVKNFETPIWSDEQTYQEVIERVVPEEFRGIVELTNEPMMTASYWAAPWHDSYWSLFMPLQLFSRRHPEYDFVWQWEMDMRIVGNHYEFLESISKWARKQPRKELWERSQRHYVPSVHGTWEEYSAWVSSLYPEANSTIWGPVLPEEFEAIEPPQPPTASPEEDNYEWGVGEDADLITLLPMFNPEGTSWNLGNDCRFYKEGDKVPRRAAIVTASRLSKGLLWRMHEENAQRKHSCASEMWPATAALHHGLKAVYAPHPIWLERDWKDVKFIENIFNGGTKGSTNKDSVYGINEHNYSGTTWFFNSRWARMLYRVWMGYEENGIGGREWETERGNMCLNAVMLHPVKGITPVNEH